MPDQLRVRLGLKSDIDQVFLESLTQIANQLSLVRDIVNSSKDGRPLGYWFTSEGSAQSGIDSLTQLCSLVERSTWERLSSKDSVILGIYGDYADEFGCVFDKNALTSIFSPGICIDIEVFNDDNSVADLEDEIEARILWDHGTGPTESSTGEWVPRDFEVHFKWRRPADEQHSWIDIEAIVKDALLLIEPTSRALLPKPAMKVSIQFSLGQPKAGVSRDAAKIIAEHFDLFELHFKRVEH